MKNFIYYFLFAFFINFILSCTEDDVSKTIKHHDHIHHEKTEMKKISFQEMKNILKKANYITLPASLELINEEKNNYISQR